MGKSVPLVIHVTPSQALIAAATCRSRAANLRAMLSRVSVRARLTGVEVATLRADLRALEAVGAALERAARKELTSLAI